MVSKKKKKILIVEDEQPIVKILKEKLKKYELYSAGNGIEGLEMAKKIKPDLILLDLIMPKMDGTEMLKKLRSTSWGKHIPVMILSNLSYTEKEKEEILSTVDDYLVKSNWNIQDITNKVIKKLEG